MKHEWIENCIYINPDNIANEIFGDWNSVDSVLKAAKYSQELREKCINEGTSLIFETVLSAEDKIDFIYNLGLKHGALGGKLLGAGGGGFFLFYVPLEKRNFFLKKINKFLNIPFKFSHHGSKIILNKS